MSDKPSLESSLRTNYILLGREFGGRLFKLVSQDNSIFVSAKQTVLAWAVVGVCWVTSITEVSFSQC